ncbi:hypothetical protein [Streptomyces sp. NPDC093093]|uniref:hypothetical protein n=2 Tax=unclassified Streptomyces TaxID=2593676 RepID=UPI003815E29A
MSAFRLRGGGFGPRAGRPLHGTRGGPGGSANVSRRTGPRWPGMTFAGRMALTAALSVAALGLGMGGAHADTPPAPLTPPTALDPLLTSGDLGQTANELGGQLTESLND